MKIRSTTKYSYTFYPDYKRPHKNFAFELLSALEDNGILINATYSVDDGIWYMGKVKYDTKDLIDMLIKFLSVVMDSDIKVKYK